MFVISRNNLVTPVEMVGADKINKKTRSVFTHQNFFQKSDKIGWRDAYKNIIYT